MRVKEYKVTYSIMGVEDIFVTFGWSTADGIWQAIKACKSIGGDLVDVEFLGEV